MLHHPLYIIVELCDEGTVLLLDLQNRGIQIARNSFEQELSQLAFNNYFRA